MSNNHPRRIVCLSAEAVEVLYRVGGANRIVGVTGFATEPAAVRRKPRVSGFSSFQYDKIDALRPDLVITFSDVQAEAARELIRRGHTVLATNQRSLEEIFDTILLIGRTVDRKEQAVTLADEMRAEIFGARKSLRSKRDRPRVYFEEWPEPHVTGIGWVSELIEAAGGTDVFAELRDKKRAQDRVVTGEEIIRRQPDIIVASWCGKTVSTSAILKRPGWAEIPAVRAGRVYEIKSGDILQPGPGVIRGFRELRRILSIATD